MNILIVGLGSIGNKHIIAIKKIIPDAVIYALRSDNKTESIFGTINIFKLDEIKNITIDFAIISNPTSLHKKIITQLIPYKIPLFIEKPVHNHLDIEDLIKNIQKNKIITYVGYNLRFLDCIKYIKEHVYSLFCNKINEVNVYCGSYLPDWRPYIDYTKTYSANKDFAGGVNLDLSHELDYIYWIFGEPMNILSYYRKKSTLSISSVDYANYNLEYNDFCINIVLNYYRRDPKRTIEIVFDNETWEIDLLQNKIICNNQIIFFSAQQIVDTYFKQMEYFIKCIKAKLNTFNTIFDGYNVLKICLNQSL